MRGLRSRLAVSALALVLGVAGARSSGISSPAGATACVPEATGAHVSLADGPWAVGLGQQTEGSGWKESESERTGPRLGGGRPCRAPLPASSRVLRALAAAPEPLELPSRRSSGLLGLGTSPANAPPRS